MDLLGVANDAEGAYDQVAWQDTSHMEVGLVDQKDSRLGQACPDSSVEVASFEDLEDSNAVVASEAEFVSFSFLSQLKSQAQGPTSNLCRPAQSSETPDVGRDCDGHYSANP